MLTFGTLDKDDICMIRGIDPDKVERYGARFLKLINDARQRYEEMRGSSNDHADIIASENEYGDGDDLFGDQTQIASSEEETGHSTFSRFFSSRKQASGSRSAGPSKPASSRSGKRNTTKRAPRKGFKGHGKSRAHP